MIQRRPRSSLSIPTRPTLISNVMRTKSQVMQRRRLPPRQNRPNRSRTPRMRSRTQSLRKTLMMMPLPRSLLERRPRVATGTRLSVVLNVPRSRRSFQKRRRMRSLRSSQPRGKASPRKNKMSGSKEVALSVSRLTQEVPSNSFSAIISFTGVRYFATHKGNLRTHRIR